LSSRQRQRSRNRRRGAAALLVALVAGLATGPAATATAPAPGTRGVVLTEPGVVLLRTTVAVTIRLTVTDRHRLSGLSSLRRGYRFPYASGSGFVASPDGTVVTASHVIEPPRDDIRNRAANQLFFGELRRAGQSLAGRSPYGRYHLRASRSVPAQAARVLDALLQDCYQTVACSFASRTSVAVYPAAQIAGGRAPRGHAVRVLRSTGYGSTDVAVLRIAGTNLPTVALGTSADGLSSGDAVTALGFAGSAQRPPTGVTAPTRASGRVSDVRNVGASRQIRAHLRGEPGISGGPVIADDGQVVGLASYARLDGRPRQTQAFLRTIDDVREAITEAGLQPARGQVDALFGQGMALFWEEHYSAAVPLFQRVLDLYDGHPAARRYLAQAQGRAGTPEDRPVPVAAAAGGDRLPVVPLVVGLLVLGAVVPALLLARRPGRLDSN
jgi:serine protease Do